MPRKHAAHGTRCTWSLWHRVHLVQLDRDAHAPRRNYRHPIEGVANMPECDPRPRGVIEHDALAALDDIPRHFKPASPGRSGYHPRDPGCLVRPVVVDLAHDVTVNLSGVTRIDLLKGSTPGSLEISSVGCTGSPRLSQDRADLGSGGRAPAGEHDQR